MELKIKASRLFEDNYNTDQRITVNQGGTSSGKTFAILQAIIVTAYNNDGCLISIVSESLPHLKRGAIRDFMLLLMDYGVYSERWHNKTDNSFLLGGSKVEFFGADQPDKLRGARRDYLFINECNNIPKSAYDQLEVRTRKKIWLDYNPVSEFWVHEHILPQDGVKFIKSTYKDNPFLEPSIIKAIESRRELDPSWWQVYGLGEVGNIEGIVYRNWKPINEFPDECKWICMGLDFGYTNDPTALVRIGLKEGEIYLEELIYETGLTNTDITQRFKDLDIGKNIEIFADSAEPKAIETIRRAGYFIKPTEKGKDSIINGIDTVKQYKLNVTKSSVNLIKELRNYKWMEKGDKTINKPIDRYNHCFIGKTLIHTEYDTMPIKDVTAGMMVYTRLGKKRCLRVFDNGVKKVTQYTMQFDTFSLSLCCTKDHLIKTDQGWIEISRLQPDMTVYLHSDLRVRNINYIKEKGTSREATNACTRWFMNITNMKFLKVIKYTTLTATHTIITQAILKPLTDSLTSAIIQRGALKIIPKRLRTFILKELLRLRSGMGRLLERSGMLSMERNHGRTESVSAESANNAEANMKHPSLTDQNTVIKTAKLKHFERGESWKENVYDLEIEDCPEYFANGILVHNCLDALRYGISMKVKNRNKILSVSFG